MKDKLDPESQFKTNTPVRLSRILDSVGLARPDRDLSVDIEGVASSLSGRRNFLSFSTSKQPLNFVDGSVVLSPALPLTAQGEIVLLTEKPRLEFILCLNWLDENIGFEQNPRGQVHKSAEVHKSAIVEFGAKIGPRSRIGAHAVIRSCVSIGENCEIGAGSVIGDPGFGYETSPNQPPLRFTHLAGVDVGNNVIVGNGATIARGSLSNTKIGDDVKIDNLVHIAHNVSVGSRSLIAASAEISGSVVMGVDVWVGPNSSVRDGVHVGDRALIGIGAVVMRDVREDAVVAGNPARELPRNKNENR